MADVKIRIGTRGSPLALAQAHETRDRLSKAHGVDPSSFEIVVIKTSGDMIQDRALAEAGGKGLFTKEIDIAMLAGEIDIAVHSSKDLPTLIPDGIIISGYLPREDPRDALIAPRAARFVDLPKGAKLGTASLRRGAMAKRLRPDLQVSLLRGNVQTRLNKAESGEIDATLLAYAGLRRLGLADRATAVLEPDEFLPAVGQGAIGITARTDDANAVAALAPILHPETGIALAAERAFLTVLDGSCKTPIAGHAQIKGGMVVFRGLVLRPDGSEAWEVQDESRPNNSAAMGDRAGRSLKALLPGGVTPGA